MKINADFNKRVVVHYKDMPWQPSPVQGVRRKMYDRIGSEIARATTLVEYAPNSKFPTHTHTGGEEFIVLEGVFQDEHGDYSTGSYVRNPPQSAHTPGSIAGCLIFVKLWQFNLNDRNHLKLNMNTQQEKFISNHTRGSVIPLHRDIREYVRLEIWEAGARVSIDAYGGAELLVLDGSFEQEGDEFQYLSWLRSPIGSTVKAVAGPNGARVWIKTNHLLFVNL